MEPAFYEKPVFLGPHLGNFALLADQFLRSGAARVVSGKKDLAEAFLMKDEKSLQDMGKRAKALLNALQGATERTLQSIENLMSEGQT